MMLNTGLKPLFAKYVIFSLKVSIIDSSFIFVTDVDKIVLDDQSYSTNMAVFPSINLVGNFLV